MIDEKLKYDEDLLESYSGLWGLFSLLKDGRSALGPERETKEDIESGIPKLWRMFRANPNVEYFSIEYGIIKYSDVKMMMAMPGGNS